MMYRRSLGKHEWHFCQACQWWPVSSYTEANSRPTLCDTDILCGECQRLLAGGSCNSVERPSPNTIPGGPRSRL